MSVGFNNKNTNIDAFLNLYYRGCWYTSAQQIKVDKSSWTIFYPFATFTVLEMKSEIIKDITFNIIGRDTERKLQLFNFDLRNLEESERI